jgi:RNA polymerase sigma-70 factor (ECF subfamily)
MTHDRWYRNAGADRWGVPRAAFDEALERSLAKAFSGRTPAAAERDRYLHSLHLEDLALACACALGAPQAWDHFVAEYRPVLYRAADAIDAAGRAREAADALYGELFGLKERAGVRQSLFHYFHGRSSLATWLRSLVAQRYVDVIRSGRRTDPLPDELPVPGEAAPPDPDRPRFAAAMQSALAAAIAALAPRDRLRLGCYYAEQMTLAAIGRITGEHEATVSRQLARTRRAIRDDVEQRLRDDHHFDDGEISGCFASMADDAGAIDLSDWLPAGERKNSAVNRSLNRK